MSNESEEPEERHGPVEIALVGDLTDNEGELCDKLLGVEPEGECVLYFDSPGGSPYCALSLMSLILLRKLRATGIVTGECSSAALWPFAACQRRLVTPYSVLLFHPMKWQSEEHVGLAEAAEWARHFAQLEVDMDSLLADLFKVPAVDMNKWISPGRYVSGREMVKAGLAEMLDIAAYAKGISSNGARRSVKSKIPRPRVEK
ncbi:MAG: ATP-dependent Clp protease proteolytic subunit [Planctomycetia bacterium]|nr:ATP-dependent Clp protease proteolytic subunit [Planctomycetia bacterium]